MNLDGEGEWAKICNRVGRMPVRPPSQCVPMMASSLAGPYSGWPLFWMVRYLLTESLGFNDNKDDFSRKLAKPDGSKPNLSLIFTRFQRMACWLQFYQSRRKIKRGSRNRIVMILIESYDDSYAFVYTMNSSGFVSFRLFSQDLINLSYCLGERGLH